MAKKIFAAIAVLIVLLVIVLGLKRKTESADKPQSEKQDMITESATPDNQTEEIIIVDPVEEEAENMTEEPADPDHPADPDQTADVQTESTPDEMVPDESGTAQNEQQENPVVSPSEENTEVDQDSNDLEILIDNDD